MARGRNSGNKIPDTVWDGEDMSPFGQYAYLLPFVRRRVSMTLSSFYQRNRQQVVEDLVQDTFLQAQRLFHSFDPSRGSNPRSTLVTWINMVAWNIVRNWLRKELPIDKPHFTLEENLSFMGNDEWKTDCGIGSIKTYKFWKPLTSTQEDPDEEGVLDVIGIASEVTGMTRDAVFEEADKMKPNGQHTNFHGSKLKDHMRTIKDVCGVPKPDMTPLKLRPGYVPKEKREKAKSVKTVERSIYRRPSGNFQVYLEHTSFRPVVSATFDSLDDARAHRDLWIIDRERFKEVCPGMWTDGKVCVKVYVSAIDFILKARELR